MRAVDVDRADAGVAGVDDVERMVPCPVISNDD